MINGRRLREYGFVASFYSVAVGILYLWGYWSSFDINILEYISLTDIVKVTILPILSSFSIFVVGAVTGELMSASKLPDGGGVNTPTGQFSTRHKEGILAVYILCICLVYVFDSPHKWLVLPVLISVPISIGLRKYGFLRDLIPGDSANRTIVFLLCTLPFYAYGHGLMKARTIIDGIAYKYLELEASKLPATISDQGLKDTKLKFLGFLNNFVFLMPVGGKTIIVAKFDSIEPIALKSYSNSK
jgi:hypothetical protein